jgi:hypothetical protein
MIRYAIASLVRMGWSRKVQLLPTPHLINLPSRNDRLDAVTQVLRRVGLVAKHVPGVEHTNGAIGCALAHRNLLREARAARAESVWIIEDDTDFVVDKSELERLVAQFLASPGIDVLCLSHLTPKSTLPISKDFAITVSTYTTACYLVKPRAMAALEKSFTKSAYMLSLGSPRQAAAIDVYWRRLQKRKLVFCVPRRQVAFQVPSFSDIEGEMVDYFPGADAEKI